MVRFHWRRYNVLHVIVDQCTRSTSFVDFDRVVSTFVDDSGRGRRAEGKKNTRNAQEECVVAREDPRFPSEIKRSN